MRRGMAAAVVNSSGEQGMARELDHRSSLFAMVVWFQLSVSKLELSGH